MNFPKLLKLLFRTFPKRMPFIILLTILSGLLESVGIGVIIPIFEFFFQGKEFEANSAISSYFYSFITSLGIPVSLTSFFSLIIIIFGIKSALKFAEIALTNKMIRYHFFTQSTTFYNALIHSDWNTFSNQKQGRLLNLFTEELNKYCNILNKVIGLFSEIALLLFYFVLALLVSAKLTFCILGLLIITSFFIRHFHGYIKQLANLKVAANHRYLETIQELLTHHKWVKYSGNYDGISAEFTAGARHKSDAEYTLHTASAILPTSFLFLSIISLTVIAYLSLITFSLNFPSFLLITVIFYRLYPRFQQIQLQIQSMAQLFPSVIEIHRYIDYFSDQKEDGASQAFTEFSSDLRLNELSFNYPDQQSFALDHLNLTIRKNEFVAIVGPSGCGKTSLIDVILGILPPHSGQVLVDGVPLTDYDIATYRRYFGLVSQDISLFNKSIRDNLTWGLQDVSEEAILEACKKAHALDFIQSFDEGLDTMVGDRGVKLSGGQKQRLSLARALLKQPEVLILDEATSALDAESETIIHNSVNALKGKLTLIIISHRIASVKQADRIIVMDKGSIVDEGSWEELSAKDGKFKLFKDLQLLD